MPTNIAKRQETLRRFKQHLADDRILFLGVAAFVVCGLAYLFITGKFNFVDSRETLFDYAAVWMAENGIIYPLAVLGLGWAHITIRLDKRRKLAYRHMFNPRRMSRFYAGMVLMLAFVPFRSMFGSIKNVISEGQGFIYDRAFADLDKTIHFGQDPFHWLYQVFSHPWIFKIIEFNYETVWFILCYATQYWVAVAVACDKIRLRYMLTFMLSWILVGNVMATWFSSAGPVYYGLITGDYLRFAPIVDLVHSEGGTTAQFQNYLWMLYSQNIPGLGSGISAFPSMHVAIVTINALFLIEVRPKFTIPALLYVAFVMMSSVYLGWHYAVDGYVAFAMVVGIYFALKKVTSVKWSWRKQGAVSEGVVVAE